MQSDECLSIYHTGSDTLFDAIWRAFVDISHWEWHYVRCNLTSVCRYITLGVTLCSMQSDECLSIYHTGSDTLFDAIWRAFVDITHWEWHSVRCDRTSVCRYITLGVTLCSMQSDECLSIYHTGSDTMFDAIWRVFVDISHWEWHSVRCNLTSVCRYNTLGVTLCSMQSDERLSI